MAYGGAYASSVHSLSSSLSSLESSVGALGEAVADYPRLTSVLKTVRHYELIPQPALASAESSLRDEIGPFISLLLDRAEHSVERTERRVDTLKARSELNLGRMAGSDHPTKAKSKAKGKSAGFGGRKKAELAPEAALRAKMLTQKKAQLQYGVERLELEVAQKERELRRRLEGR